MRRVSEFAGRLLTLLVLAVAASACAGERPSLDESSAAREVDPTVDLEAEPDTDPAMSSPEEAPEPVTLRLGVGADWSGDPADAGPASLVSRVLADLLHEGLTAFGSDGQVTPGLAERWFVTEDRLT